MRTTVTFEGNLADDPHVRFTASGKQITELAVLVNARRQNSDGAWVDVHRRLRPGGSRIPSDRWRNARRPRGERAG
jgi:hypothetical protein